MREYGIIQSIQRYKYGPYEMDAALNAVTMIGKAMNPRFVIDDDNRFVYENMIRWIQGDAEMKCQDPTTKEIIPGNLYSGIYVAGPTGTGKSFLLDLFAMYCRIDNVQVMFDGDEKQRRCLTWPSFRADQICEEYTQDGTIDRYKKMNVMAIQDLGSEPAESMYMGNRVNVLRQIIEYRGDRNNQITLISSNLPIEYSKTAERYGDRVVSRLHSLTNYFELKGKDRRK